MVRVLDPDRAVLCVLAQEKVAVMIEWIIAFLIAGAGLVGVAVTILWPFDRPRDPYAVPFGDLPRLPSNSLDRGDCA